MPFGRLRELFGSLRFRLTFWNSLVFWCAIILVLTGVRLSMRLAMGHEADSQLLEDADELRLLIARVYPDEQQIFDEFRIKTQTHKHRDLFIQILDPQQQIKWQTQNAPPGIRIPPLSGGMRKINLDSEPWHLVHFSAADGNPSLPNWTILVGATLHSVEVELERLTQTIFGVGLFAFLVTPLGGYWLASRATHPLAQIMDTTARLHPSNLDERLPLRGTRDELDRLSATINGFLDRIAGFLAKNREFTAHAAHELRSPLAAIQSSIEVALNSDRETEHYKEMLADILDECAGLTMLVNQLLILSETDAGSPGAQTQDVNLQRLVARSCEMFQGTAEVKGVRLDCRCPHAVFVKGDSQRLRQVVNNLVDNALKFTPPGKSVTVELLPPVGNEWVILKVIDEGVGIPPEELKHVFERFYTVDRARTRGGPNGRGSGLGLSICQSIVEAHHGRIELRSILGKGSQFEVYFPQSSSLPAGLQ